MIFFGRLYRVPMIYFYPPRMIGLDILVEVVRNNKIFQDTVFTEHPNLLYSLTTIHLLDI